MGLRDLKKQQTRDRIVETARRLFAERGFDRVTVADIAREAQVALATVFNYFSSKEELFYSPLEAFGERLIEVVRTRDAGEPALVAMRRFLGGTGGLLARLQDGDGDALAQMRAMHRVVADSPALLARERQALARVTDDLAAVLAGEAGAGPGDPEASVAANALMGVHRALLDHVRRRVLADADPAGLEAEVGDLCERAFALLEHGLGGYAPKPPA